MRTPLSSEHANQSQAGYSICSTASARFTARGVQQLQFRERVECQASLPSHL